MSCPVCKKKTAPEYRPFCSRRCADLDLANWLNDAYAIASDDTVDDEDLTGPDIPGAERLQ